MKAKMILVSGGNGFLGVHVAMNKSLDRPTLFVQENLSIGNCISCKVSIQNSLKYNG